MASDQSFLARTVTVDASYVPGARVIPSGGQCPSQGALLSKFHHSSTKVIYPFIVSDGDARVAE